MREKSVDFAMVGESDFEFPKLVDCLVNGANMRTIKNLVYKNAANEIQMASEPLTRTVMRNDITSLPHPAWDLFNM
jgi:hypothetical protein